MGVTCLKKKHMTSLLFIISKAMFYLKVHVAKTKRHARFIVPTLFKNVMEVTEILKVFKKCNK